MQKRKLNNYWLQTRQYHATLSIKRTFSPFSPLSTMEFSVALGTRLSIYEIVWI